MNYSNLISLRWSRKPDSFFRFYVGACMVGKIFHCPKKEKMSLASETVMPATMDNIYIYIYRRFYGGLAWMQPPVEIIL